MNSEAMRRRSETGVPRAFMLNSTFFCTVIHGKRPWSWNTMAVSVDGPSISWPATAIWPEVAVSSPAIIMSSVDFPQPERPSRQTNSPSSPTKSMPRSASTDSVLPGKILPTPTHSMKRFILGCSFRVGREALLPAADIGAREPHQLVGQQADRADHDDARHDEIGAEGELGVQDHVAQARLHRDHLGGHHGEPSRADRQPQAGEDGVQRGGQNNVAHHQHLARAGGTRDLDQGALDAPHAEDG